MGTNKNMMRKIQRALISVSDKSNLKELLRVLKKYDIEIISSGGTFKKIKKLRYKCIEVSNFTNSPEILDGRVKTLHPKIHSGILFNRSKKKHLSQMKKRNFKPIDLLIINFYPFKKTLQKTKHQDKIVENIDIGGPAMVRAAWAGASHGWWDAEKLLSLPPMFGIDQETAMGMMTNAMGEPSVTLA